MSKSQRHSLPSAAVRGPAWGPWRGPSARPCARRGEGSALTPRALSSPLTGAAWKLGAAQRGLVRQEPPGLALGMTHKEGLWSWSALHLPCHVSLPPRDALLSAPPGSQGHHSAITMPTLPAAPQASGHPSPSMLVPLPFWKTHSSGQRQRGEQTS